MVVRFCAGLVGLAKFGAGLENILDGLRGIRSLVDAQTAGKLFVGLAQIVLEEYSTTPGIGRW